MAITSAFQADDAGSIPAARSSFKAKSTLLRVGFLFFIYLVRRHAYRFSALRQTAETEKAPEAPFQINSVAGAYSCSSSPQKR